MVLAVVLQAVQSIVRLQQPLCRARLLHPVKAAGQYSTVEQNQPVLVLDTVIKMTADSLHMQLRNISCCVHLLSRQPANNLFDR